MTLKKAFKDSLKDYQKKLFRDVKKVMTQTLIQELHINKSSDKIQKPNFETRTGREFLAFYLSTKLKQVVAYDKKYQKNFILSTGNNFLSIFLKNLINSPHNSIVVGIYGDETEKFCEKISKSAKELELPVVVAEGFCALLEADSKVVVVRCSDNPDSECKKIIDEKLDVKIYAKRKKEYLETIQSGYDIIVDGECSKEHLLEILNYIKIITNDFSPAQSF